MLQAVYLMHMYDKMYVQYIDYELMSKSESDVEVPYASANDGVFIAKQKLDQSKINVFKYR